MGEIRNIIYAPSGELIATASNGEHIAKIWNAASGACLHSYSTYGSIHRMLISRRADRLHVKTGDRLLTYDLTSYTLISTLQCSDRRSLDCVYSQWGNTVVTSSATDPYTIHSPGTLNQPRRVQSPRCLTSPAAVSPDDTELIAASGEPGETKALTFDAETGQHRRTFELPGHAQKITYAPDGIYIAFIFNDGSVNIFDRVSAMRVARLDPLPAGGVLDSDITFLPDNSALIIPDNSGNIHVLNVRDALRLQ
ncbi:WD40 repeat domain-containing protein [Phanerochaete sordida]|uniref:WD40 repeat domain-containing protein n=1 Tax=Phanerochaete sordida TaxID=48140 RepID=A0A9P3GII9_9APHY|nr:WD40 repeat domain-containing protein [Phanerochaete sordida]